MKHWTAGFGLALIATVVAAQQAAPRPQVIRTPSAEQEALQEALASSGAAPLQSKAKLQAYNAALQTPGVVQLGDLGTPVKITPRAMYLNSSTYAVMWRGTVAPQMGPTGVAHVFGKVEGSSNYSMLEIRFRTAPNTSYIVDCALTRPAKVRIGIGGPEIDSVENHFVGAVAAGAASRAVEMKLVSDRGFEWTQCDIVPVNR